MAKKLGFERVVVKKGSMKCYTIDNPESPYYDSEVFTKVLGYVTNNPRRASMKQTPKNIVINILGVRNLNDACKLLEIINNSEIPVNS